MFFVEKFVSNDEIYIRDTTDSVLECYTLRDLIDIQYNYDAIIYGLEHKEVVGCKCFKLLNKDKIIGFFCITTSRSNIYRDLYSEMEEVGALPLDYTDIKSWVDSRRIFTCARDVKEFFKAIGVNNDADFINIFHCISLHDTFWVSEYSSELTWLKVSPYHNDYSKFVSRYSLDGIIGKKDFNYLSPDVATLGSFPSTWRYKGVDNIYYLKGSSKYTLGGRNSGKEPFSEFFSCQVAQFLGFRHIDYKIRSYTRGDGAKDVITVCKSYTSNKIGSITAHLLGLESYKGVIEYCISNLSDISVNTILDMLFLDCITLNTDRHFSNIEFLYDTDTLKILEIAPIFDNNYSLLPRFIEGLDKFDRDEYVARTGESFEDIFKLVSSYKNYNKQLISLKNFKFVNDSKCMVSNERLDFLNEFIQKQVTYWLSISK